MEGREKPVDILAKNIILLSKETEEEEARSKKTADISSLEVELREPYTIFEGLELEELRELLEDIRTYQSLEGDGPNFDFWRALETICLSEIETAAEAGRPDSGVHSSVLDELTATFSGKSAQELEATRLDIQSKLDGNDGSLDVEVCVVPHTWKKQILLGPLYCLVFLLRILTEISPTVFR